MHKETSFQSSWRGQALVWYRVLVIHPQSYLWFFTSSFNVLVHWLILVYRLLFCFFCKLHLAKYNAASNGQIHLLFKYNNNISWPWHAYCPFAYVQQKHSSALMLVLNATICACCLHWLFLPQRAACWSTETLKKKGCQCREKERKSQEG